MNEKEDIKSLLEKASVSLLLDSYDGVFSDFDPRPFSERAISDDFLSHAKKATVEVGDGNFELRFLIPKHLKNVHEESTIRDRLHRHFRKHLAILEHDAKRLILKGVLLTALGFLLMFFAALLNHSQPTGLELDFLKILFEPSGWFLVWYGLDQIFYFSKEAKPDLQFYRKMVKAELHFDPY